MGIEAFARIVTTGSVAPGATLPGSPKDSLDTFEKADPVFPKGQGNYEALEGVKKENILFLLQVKCPVVVRDLKAGMGEIVLMTRTDNCKYAIKMHPIMQMCNNFEGASLDSLNPLSK